MHKHEFYAVSSIITRIQRVTLRCFNKLSNMLETCDPSEEIFDDSRLDDFEDVNIKNSGHVRWTSNSGLILQGFCKKDYAPVKEMFESFFKTGREKNAQLCVYVKNEVVVDLYGTAIGDSSYGANSLHVWYFPIIS